MKRLRIEPDGWPCKLKECRPGFFLYQCCLCFKTEYGEREVFCDSGEYFRPNTDFQELVVQPVQAIWFEEEAHTWFEILADGKKIGGSE